MRESNSVEEIGIHSTMTIDFKSLFMVLLDGATVIILSGITVALAVFLLFSTVLHLNYESTTKIYIMPEETGANSSYVSLEVGSLLTTDYAEMIVGRDILESAISFFELDTTYERFIHKVHVENPVDTRILYISVSDPDPYLARNLVLYIRDLAIEEIRDSMGNEGISVIEQANLPVKTKISEKVLSVVFGLVAMMIVSLGIIIRYMTIDTIVSADDIENRLKMVVLGTISYEKGRP